MLLRPKTVRQNLIECPLQVDTVLAHHVDPEVILAEFPHDLAADAAGREVVPDDALLAAADEQIWRRVWTREERINNASTPMFLVEGRKAKLWEN